ncbi:MAG: DUF4173 domain-containing protein [Roseburia sp.]|nr:DUF4173 domain-containing protein [Roseburia sp.]
MSEVNVTWIDNRGEAGVQPSKGREATQQTDRLKENFPFFGPATCLYAILYAFCMYKNSSGVTFPFFVAGSLFYFCFSLARLELTLKRGSCFYIISMMLLSVSTFCTDDGRIIAFNKTGIFLLMMSLLLKQFYDTSRWKLGKYLASIIQMTVMSFGQLGRPIGDGRAYYKGKENKKDSKQWYVVLGALTALPLLLVVMALLSSADAVFREMTGKLLQGIHPGNLFNILFRIAFLFFASYALLAYLCTHAIKEEVKDRRRGEPLLAVTVTGLLSLLYVVFCGIQILYLFLGNMQLPEGYTYAEYAREGFFQLLAVSILNLVIVLICLTLFRESRLLKAVLTVMSLCTFVMIASSAMRMMIYVHFYSLTFLRLLVLWALVVLFFLFMGVMINIYKEDFGLFRYSMVVVTVLYLALSFAHPDYLIAKVNVAKAAGEESMDYRYLSGLNADAAPVMIPYLKELGYDFDIFYREADKEAYSRKQFGYYYLFRLKQEKESFSIRSFNISRYMAFRQVERYAGK